MANQLTEKLVLDSSNFDKNIGSVVKKVEELKNKGKTVGGGFNSSFGKMIAKATGFNGSMTSLIGVVGKFSGALGATTAALKVAKDAFFASEATYDEWQRVVKSSESVYNGFLNSINNGDISGFLSNIDQIVSAAREAYNALDTLGTMRTIQAPQISKQETENQRMLMMLRTGRYIAPQDGRAPTPGLKDGDKLTKAQLEKLERQLTGGINKIIGYTKNEITQTRKAVDAYYNKLAQENRMSYNEFREGTSSWAEFSKKMQGYQKYKDWEAEAQARFAKQGGRGHMNFDSSNPYYKFKKWGNFRVDKMGEGSYNELVNLIKSGNQQEAQLYSTIGQAYRTFNKVDKQTSGGGGRGGRGGGSTEIDYAVNSVGWLEKQIAELKKEIKLQVDYTEIENLNEQIKALQLQLDALQRPYKPIKLAFSGATPSLINSVPSSNEQIAKGKTPETKVNTLQDQYKHWTDIANNVFENYDIGAIASDRATELIKEINKNIQSLGLKPIKLDIITDKEKLFVDIQESANSLVNGFGAIDSVVSNITSLAEAIHQGADAWQIFMGVLETGVGIINSVATVLETVNTLQELFGTTALSAASAKAAAGATEVATSEAVTTANVTEAGTEAVKQGAKMPFPLNLVAIAASVAAVLAALAAVGAFANGGIVGGNSYSGDRLFARVNSGEAILNQNQQKHLFTLLDGNHGSGSVSGNVNFVIKGKDLHGCLANYDNQMSKVR